MHNIQITTKTINSHLILESHLNYHWQASHWYNTSDFNATDCISFEKCWKKLYVYIAYANANIYNAMLFMPIFGTF